LGSRVRERTGFDMAAKRFSFAINVLRLTNLARDLLWVTPEAASVRARSFALPAERLRAR